LQEPLNDGQQLYYAGREGAAAPASGIVKLHIQQQQELIEAALGITITATESDGAIDRPKKKGKRGQKSPRKDSPKGKKRTKA
jgi:2-oxoglutarate dehydrogenase E1 component